MELGVRDQVSQTPEGVCSESENKSQEKVLNRLYEKEQRYKKIRRDSPNGFPSLHSCVIDYSERIIFKDNPQFKSLTGILKSSKSWMAQDRGQLQKHYSRMMATLVLIHSLEKIFWWSLYHVLLLVNIKSDIIIGHRGNKQGSALWKA